jgi:hypothetical protein
VEIKKFLGVIVRLFNEEQVLEIIDDAFHRFAIDSRWEAQEYIKENFFTSTTCASPKPAPEIVESETVCHYCIKGKIDSRKTDCCKCAGYNNFVGRRLQA